MSVFERERMQVGKGQRERETQNLKQAPGSELSSTECKGAQTHEPGRHQNQVFLFFLKKC